LEQILEQVIRQLIQEFGPGSVLEEDSGTGPIKQSYRILDNTCQCTQLAYTT